MENTVGIRIRERRKKLKMKQEDLAKASNVSRATISALENGRCENVLVGTLLAIAKALNTSVEKFFA